MPFFGPIAAARVGFVDGGYVLNPTLSEMDDSALDLVVAGTKEGVLMVESEASELSEEVMLGAVTFGHQQMQSVIDAIVDLAEVAAKEPRDLPEEAPEAALICAIALLLSETKLKLPMAMLIKQNVRLLLLR